MRHAWFCRRFTAKSCNAVRAAIRAPAHAPTLPRSTPVPQVFVANPNKPQPIVDILANNRDKLLKYLEDFHTEKGERRGSREGGGRVSCAQARGSGTGGAATKWSFEKLQARRTGRR